MRAGRAGRRRRDIARRRLAAQHVEARAIGALDPALGRQLQVDARMPQRPAAAVAGHHIAVHQDRFKGLHRSVWAEDGDDIGWPLYFETRCCASLLNMRSHFILALRSPRRGVSKGEWERRAMPARKLNLRQEARADPVAARMIRMATAQSMHSSVAPPKLSSDARPKALAPQQAAVPAAEPLPDLAVELKGLTKVYDSAGRMPAKIALDRGDLAIPPGAISAPWAPTAPAKRPPSTTP